MESPITDEKPTQIGARFGPEGYVNNTKPKLSEERKPRAVLALEAFNTALDELNYKGNTLPAIVFSNDLSVHDVPKVAGMVREYGEKNMPTIFIDLSDKVADKGYGYISLLMFKRQGMSNEQIARMTLVGAIFEEAKHYVDLLENKIPEGTGPAGTLPGYEGKYYKQPHEAEARVFSEEMLQKHKELYKTGPNIYFENGYK